MAIRKRGVPTSSEMEATGGSERSGVSLEEVSNRTKISIRFLKAIECGDFKQLPGGIIAISYLRQYAAAVGIDAEPLVRRYQELISPPVPKAPEPESRAGILERLFRVPA